MNSSKFTNYLLRQCRKYDDQIIRDMRPMDPWIGHVDVGPVRPDWAFDWMTTDTACAMERFNREWNRKNRDNRFPYIPTPIENSLDRFNSVYPDVNEKWDRQ